MCVCVCVYVCVCVRVYECSSSKTMARTDVCIRSNSASYPDTVLSYEHVIM